MKVSVVTPVYDWPHLDWLHRFFKQQTHPDKELLLLDDSPAPVERFARLEDPEVRYVHSGERMTIGAKRNRLLELASGELVAHFDQDDYYAPRYLERMVERMRDADLVTLDGWFAFDTPTRSLFYWQTSEIRPVQFRVGPRGLRALELAGTPRLEEWTRRNVLGYGFSYVYRRNLFPASRFPDTTQHDEDMVFVESVLRQGGRIAAIDDREGLLLHLTHRTGMSTIYPNYALPLFLLPRLFGEEAEGYLREVFGQSLGGSRAGPAS